MSEPTPSTSSTPSPSTAPNPVEEVVSVATGASADAVSPWQAVYSPQYGAYYFYNGETQETTWENPLSKDVTEKDQKENLVDAAAENDTPPPTSSYTALQQAALAQGIDPSLAYLDPSLAGPSNHSVPGSYDAAAKFNARTGQFTRLDARDPTHLSEYERAKRMSEFYFDVGKWEEQRAADVAEEEANGGKKRKRPTKKDLDRFKEQKRLKKIAKTAWLRT